MQIFSSIESFPKLSTPLALTIGNYDGIHLGHHYLINQLIQKAKEIGGKSAVLTFENHPSSILHPDNKIEAICTPSQKLRLLKQLGIDFCFLIPFDLSFSQQSSSTFLEQLSSFLPLKSLVLGYDTLFGRRREGTRERVKQVAEEIGFSVDYLDPFQIDHQILSCSLIRPLIKEGKFDLVNKYLGRPYSIYSTVSAGNGKGKSIGFPTANIDVDHLSLPPHGVYAVDVILDKETYSGVANLGVAPTLKNGSNPILEVHLINFSENLYGKSLEVVFKKFIRAEKKFATAEQLKKQIEIDTAGRERLK